MATNREAIQGVDVLLSVTNSNVPTFDGDWLEPGVHLCSIVSSNIGLMRGRLHPAEAARGGRQDPSALRYHRLQLEAPGDPGRAPECCGIRSSRESSPGTMCGIWARSSPGRCRAGPRRSRSASTRTTLSWGVGDQAIGELLYQRAVEKGLGTELPIDGAEYRET